jgi:hypothetical protein
VLATFLRDSLDVFVWKISDMPRILSEMIKHKLRIDPSFNPIKQKERRYTTERHEGIRQDLIDYLKLGSSGQQIIQAG